MTRHLARLLLLAAPLALAACYDANDQHAIDLTGGDPARGRAALRHYGCISCHTIPGVAGADALVGPPLNRIGARTYLAGVLVNSPQNMQTWIKDPPAVDPKTAMPKLNVTDADARDIACYLYTLR
jgi:cytochrome c2